MNPLTTTSEITGMVRDMGLRHAHTADINTAWSLASPILRLTGPVLKQFPNMAFTSLNSILLLSAGLLTFILTHSAIKDTEDI